MRVVLFGTGSPMSLAALDALTSKFSVVAIVAATPRSRGLRGAAARVQRWRATRPFFRAARRHRVPIVWSTPRQPEALLAALRRVGADVYCVAAFPQILKADVLALAPRGVLNVHPSLLPRHRGPSPLFWTYVHDDVEAGVTVHWMDTGVDTGDIVFRDVVPLARGRALRDLYRELCGRGAALLTRAVVAIEAGSAPRMAQEESQASHEPAPATAPRIEFATWSAERLWHVLAGMGAVEHRLLSDEHGSVFPHGPALGYVLRTPDRTPGTVERHGAGWRVYCRDGVVDVARAPVHVRFREVFRRWQR